MYHCGVMGSLTDWSNAVGHADAKHVPEIQKGGRQEGLQDTQQRLRYYSLKGIIFRSTML